MSQILAFIAACAIAAAAIYHAVTYEPRQYGPAVVLWDPNATGNWHLVEFPDGERMLVAAYDLVPGDTVEIIDRPFLINSAKRRVSDEQ